MDKRVQLVVRLMEKNLKGHLSIAELAQATNLSESRLQHLFKAETGMTPVSYLMALRMQRARGLLENSFLSVKEVMDLVGVKDKSHFNRSFKRAYGLSPSQLKSSISALAKEDQGPNQGND